MSEYPAVTIQNNLNSSVLLWGLCDDPSVPAPVPSAPGTYFGPLTPVTEVAAGQSQQFNLVPATYIAYSNSAPIARELVTGGAGSTLVIDNNDTARMATTNQFIDFISNNPNDSLTTSFLPLLIGSNPVAAVNAFFQGNTQYQSCTFDSYLLAVLTRANTISGSNNGGGPGGFGDGPGGGPGGPGGGPNGPGNGPSPFPYGRRPGEQPQLLVAVAPGGDDHFAPPGFWTTYNPNGATYSLQTLCGFLGGTWPAGFPDISVTNFTCSTANNTLAIGGDVDLGQLPYDPDVAPYIQWIVGNYGGQVSVTFSFNYALTGGLGTRIQLQPQPPVLRLLGESVTLANPTLNFDISPLSKSVVFSASGDLPFTLWNGQNFTTIASLVLDSAEVEVGMSFKGNIAALLPPQIMKGITFKSFGVGMGLFFKQNQYSVGVQGGFGLDDPNGNVILDDAQFAVVCNDVDGEAVPIYIAFYVKQADLGDVISVFTNSPAILGSFVTVTDLAFHWSANPDASVALPDGSMSQKGYGFHGLFDVLGLSFYGDVEIDEQNLSATVAASPLTLGPLTIGGNGQRKRLRCNADGKVILNNQILNTADQYQASVPVSARQMVAAGGPLLAIDTSSSPYLNLSAGISLFGLTEQVNATVTSGGFSFSLDFGSVLSGEMRCAMQNFQDFSGSFNFGINERLISLPLDLGTLRLDAGCDASLNISVSESAVSASAGAWFMFEGAYLQVGPFTIGANIAGIEDLITEIVQFIIAHVTEIFEEFLNDALKWAKLVAEDIIEGVTNVAEVLKNTFTKAAKDAVAIMSAAGFAIEKTASDIKNAFNTAATDLASALKTAYTDVSQDVVGAALKGAGYVVNDVTSALSSVYGDTEQDVTNTLQSLGYDAEDVASALAAVFNSAPAAINTILQAAGYAVDSIESAFESLGGAFATFADDTWNAISHDLNPSNW